MKDPSWRPMPTDEGVAGFRNDMAAGFKGAGFGHGAGVIASIAEHVIGDVFVRIDEERFGIHIIKKRTFRCAPFYSFSSS